MVRRKNRDLTPEEWSLWNRVRQTANPMHQERNSERPGSDPAKILPAPPEKKPAFEAKPPRQPGEKPATSTAAWPGPRDSGVKPGAGALRMDSRRFGKMVRGRLQPESRVDLHGLTLERAHSRLNGFILGAQADGRRLVLVITGKGRPGPDQAGSDMRFGVLRQNVPRWLAMAPLSACVLQVNPAHQRHGGDGAFYVYLRRLR